MHLVYPLRNRPSQSGDMELRFSLRSVAKYIRPTPTVTVIGGSPKWLRGVNHIPCEDLHDHKQLNVQHKLVMFCRSEHADGEFVLMNDDFFFLQDVPDLIPQYILQRDLPSYRQKYQNSQYAMAMDATIEHLKAKGLPLKNHEPHFPMRFDPDRLLTVLEPTATQPPRLHRSLYGNTFGVEAEEVDRDFKLYRGSHRGDVGKRMRRDAFISTDEYIFSRKTFRSLLAKRFPDPSPWERGILASVA